MKSANMKPRSNIKAIRAYFEQVSNCIQVKVGNDTRCFIKLESQAESRNMGFIISPERLLCMADEFAFEFIDIRFVTQDLSNHGLNYLTGEINHTIFNPEDYLYSQHSFFLLNI